MSNSVKPHCFIVVVVTYNRKSLLLNCISNLLFQEDRIKRLIIVDNNSTDGTRYVLSEAGVLIHPKVDYICLKENVGGAGGFHFGMKLAIHGGEHWVYLLDDDAMAQPKVLENLEARLYDKRSAYGSLALDTRGENLCWPIVPGSGIFSGSSGSVNSIFELTEDVTKVNFIPFLGFAIHSSFIREIGLPDSEYFISGDDIEYSYRIQKAGGNLYVVKDSVLHHPAPTVESFSLFGRTFYYICLEPWRIYYSSRNKLINSRKYSGLSTVFLKTLPGILVRAFVVVSRHGCFTRNIKAYMLGIFDGILGRKGKRVEPGGI